MTPDDVLGWIGNGIVCACIAAVVGLFVRVRKNQERLAVVEAKDARAGVGALAARVGKLESAHAERRLHVAEHYISRDDWVPTVSRVIGMLEGHTRMLVRLDERTRARDAARKEGIDER